MHGKKIVLIGAGSHSFGLCQVMDILRSEELKGRGFTLSLVDTDTAALETMTKLAERIKAYTKTDASIESTTDRPKALRGATYVVTAVARKRYPLWEQDFRVPLSYGFRHCLGENGGPGAVFHALRSLELIMPICRDIETICPDALLLNFTNPEARVLHAILHLTKVKAAGICHGVFGAIRKISECLNRPAEEFEVTSAGMNPFFCVLRVMDKKTGKDLLPQVLDVVKNEPAKHGQKLFQKIAQIFDIITYPSDNHIGEYLPFGAEFEGIKWRYGQECRKVIAANEAAEPNWIEPYASGEKPIDESFFRASGEITVPIICDIELNRGSFREAVNVLNTERYIENLPTGAAIEIPARVDAKGIHPIKVGTIPETFAAYMRTQFAIHNLITEAYRTRSKRLLLQALLLDPNVNSVVSAEAMLDEMLALQSEFLPVFS